MVEAVVWQRDEAEQALDIKLIMYFLRRDPPEHS